jgi:hypothetical protein
VDRRAHPRLWEPLGLVHPLFLPIASQPKGSYSLGGALDSVFRRHLRGSLRGPLRSTPH